MKRQHHQQFSERVPCRRWVQNWCLEGAGTACAAHQWVSRVLCELGGAQGSCIRELHGLEHQVSQALLTRSVKTQRRNRCSELVRQDCLPQRTLHVPIRLTSEGFCRVWAKNDRIVKLLKPFQTDPWEAVHKMSKGWLPACVPPREPLPSPRRATPKIPIHTLGRKQ